MPKKKEEAFQDFVQLLKKVQATGWRLSHSFNQFFIYFLIWVYP